MKDNELWLNDQIDGLKNSLEAALSRAEAAEAEVARMKEESLRYYNSDGSFVRLESPEAVIKNRIRAAQKIVKATTRIAELDEIKNRTSQDEAQRMSMERLDATSTALRWAWEQEYGAISESPAEYALRCDFITRGLAALLETAPDGTVGEGE